MISGTGPTSSSPRRLVTALFDSRSEAENAIERLVNAGVPHDRIGLMPGDESEASDEAGASSRSAAACICLAFCAATASPVPHPWVVEADLDRDGPGERLVLDARRDLVGARSRQPAPDRDSTTQEARRPSGRRPEAFSNRPRRDQ